LGYGGGIGNGGTLTITDSTLSGNWAVSGGGISHVGFTLTITDSTISGNYASGNGGGIFSEACCNINTITTITDSTLSGNSAGANGGGVFSHGWDSTAFRVTSIGSLFANPTGGNLVQAGYAEFNSLGHNLFSDAPAVALDPTDLINTDPLLGPLADNGGPTFTQALLPGSPAIDAGVVVAGVTSDQRGVPRPQGSASDIGAFEFDFLTNEVPPTVVGLRRLGTLDQPATLVLRFTAAMDAPRSQNPGNYRLVGAGPDHRLGTKDDRVIPIRGVRYDPATWTVAVQPSRSLALSQPYELTVIGTPPGGLTDTSGAFLDGAGTGRPGSDYIQRFHLEDLAKATPAALLYNGSFETPGVPPRKKARTLVAGDHALL
jgi:hypothetical protein